MSAQLKEKNGVPFFLQPVCILSVLMLVWSGCTKNASVDSGEPVSGDTEVVSSSQPESAAPADGMAEVYQFIDVRTDQVQYKKIIPMIQRAEQTPPEKRTAADFLLLAIQKLKARDSSTLTAFAQAGLDLKPADRPLKGHLFYMRGLGQGATGMLKEAKGSYQNALLMIPDYEPAFLQMGLIYLEHDKNMSQAKTYLEMGLRRNPNRVEYYAGLGRIYESQGNWPKAEEMHLGELRLDPGSKSALNSLGSLYLMQEKYDEAEKMLSNPALSADAGAHYQLGVLYSKVKPDPGKAGQHFSRAVELAPDNADYHVALAAAVRTTDPEKANIHLEAALRIRPDVESYLQVARFHREAKAYKKSLDYLTEAARLNPQSPRIALEKGLVYIDQKDVNKAQAELEAAVKLNPEDGQAAYYLHLIKMDPKDPLLEEARTLAQTVLSNPADVESHHALGQYYLKDRKFNFAQMEVENLKRLNPGSALGYWLQAEIHLAQRKFGLVESELNWLIQAEPAHDRTLQIADSYYENTINIEGWEKFYRTRFSSKKDELPLQYGLLRIYNSTEDIDQMIQTLEIIVGLEKNGTRNAENYSQLADLYVEKNDNKYAQLTVKRALRSDPDNAVLKAKLEDLKKPLKAPEFLDGIPSQYVRALVIPSSQGWSKLHTAAAKGDLQKVKRLVGRGANVNAQNSKGLTPLHEAVKRNQMEVVQFLVENGADVNASSPEDQFQPLHLAAFYKRMEILDYLLSKGANIQGQTSVGDTALISVAQIEWHKDNKVARYLIKKGAQIDVVNVFGCQALCYAAKHANTDLVKLLLNKGADINFTSAKGHTPLVMAILSQDDKLVEYMLEKGADPTVKFEGINLVKLAKKLNQKRIATLLRRAQ